MVCPTIALRSLTHTVLFNAAGVSGLGSERARAYTWTGPLMVRWTRVWRWQTENLRTAGRAHEGCVKKAV